MRAQIQKWGNSLALRIPRSFAAESNIQQGSEVELSLVEGSLVIKAVRRPEYALDTLLSEVTADNLHGEIDTGPLAGNEVW